MGLRLRGCGPQSDGVDQTHIEPAWARPRITSSAVAGEFVEADIGNRDHLYLRRPTTITITDRGRGEIPFGGQASLDIEYRGSSIAFTCEGFDQMDDVHDDGAADCSTTTVIEIGFAYQNGDEAVLNETSSRAC
jgi:hypothetical protein